MSGSPSHPEPPRASWHNVLGWAAYLACSWTWCIGMFLPVLLVRDFGVFGFLVFALPNVIGAAAMGWVMRDPDHSRRVVQTHRAACIAFSVVTVSFHVFALRWLSGAVAGEANTLPRMLILAAGLVALMISLATLRPRLHWIAPTLVLLGSVVAAGVFFAWAGTGAASYLETPRLAGALPTRNLAWLAPICLFGFALCPYLDLTFHRAREHTGIDNAKGAFGIGFGVFFFAMILFTLLYSGTILSGYLFAASAAPLIIIAIHFVSQAMFTCVIHTHAIATIARPNHAGALALLAGACIAGWALGLASRTHESHGPLVAVMNSSMSIGEVIYRGYMSFYGLIFPAYAWICMIPTRSGHAGIAGAEGRRKLVTLVIAIAAASPMYWMGFIEQRTWWLAPGLAVALLARLAVLGRRLS